MITATPIRRRKLSHDVIERLTSLIASGELAPGRSLPSERELMEQYGVGRPAIREALQTLERAGVVTITHGERARVAIPTPDRLIEQVADGARHLLRAEPSSLDHLKDARLFLEVGLARRAAERATSQSVAELRSRLDAHEALMARPGEFLDGDMAFHRQIAAMSGNPIFPAIVEAMFGWLGAYHRGLVRAPGVERLTIAEHRRILDAIAAGDADGAAQAMREHITRANALYRVIADAR
jgi:DNA-binding FadR family transcriptional regulator